jgi:hypothetical protein
MISYRNSNLFESIKKQILPTPGIIYQPIEDKPWPNPYLNVSFSKQCFYLFSHIRDGKMVLIRRMAGDWVFEVSHDEINSILKPVGQADLKGFKVGDKIRRKGLSEIFIIVGFGLTGDNTPKAYCIQEGADIEPIWDFHFTSAISLMVMEKVSQ